MRGMARPGGDRESVLPASQPVEEPIRGEGGYASVKNARGVHSEKGEEAEGPEMRKPLESHSNGLE